MANKVKVRMMTSIAGNAEPTYELDDFAFQPGQEVELHPALAKAWIEGGHAVLVAEREREAFKEERETTSIEAPEKAVLPEPPPRKVGRPPKVT